MDAPEKDPSLQPPANYGSLGPAADVTLSGQPTPAEPVKKRVPLGRILLIDGVATIIGLLIALQATPVRAAWQQIAAVLGLRGKPVAASPAIMSEHELERLDQMHPQTQAELLLERATNHYAGASDQLASRVDNWRGKINMTPKLTNMITVALNANDVRVRAAAVEVQLAAYDVAKTPDAMDRLVTQAESDTHNRPWLLWTVGLLGNRGVQPDRAADVLTSYLQDPSVETRKWAVEGLAVLGTDAALQPLLTALHDDSSPVVRERAACSVAQSGLFTQEQRDRALPTLLDDASDTRLDAQTHGWVFQALRDITGKDFSNNPAAWRDWYDSARN
ncbi:MAG TPA: HEAT repeat domain-containing protein [Terriglobales bacterium]|nr:HEAT repeat domain-containing protein [Terriglobales bacterium]